MTLTAAKPGGWAFDEILTETQMNHLQAELLKAIDGVNGGAYTLGSALTFAGAAVNFDADVHVRNGGNLIVDSGGDLFIQVGGRQFVRGELEVETGGLLSVESGGDLNIEPNGTFSATALDDLVLLSAVQQEQLRLAPMMIRPAPDDWIFDDSTLGAWLQADNGAARYIAFPISLDETDELDSISVRIDGNSLGLAAHAALPAVKASIELVRVGPTGGTVALAQTIDPSGSVGAYEAGHNLLMNSASHPSVFPYVGDGQEWLFLIVVGESGANSLANYVSVSGAVVTRTFNRLRSSRVAGH